LIFFNTLVPRTETVTSLFLFEKTIVINLNQNTLLNGSPRSYSQCKGLKRS